MVTSGRSKRGERDRDRQTETERHRQGDTDRQTQRLTDREGGGGEREFLDIRSVNGTWLPRNEERERSGGWGGE